MDNPCVTNIFIAILFMCCFVLHGNLIFWLNLDFERLIRAAGKVALSVIFISSNYSSSMIIIFSQNKLAFSLGEWYGFLFIYV